MFDTRWNGWFLTVLLFGASTDCSAAEMAGSKQGPNVTATQLKTDLATARQGRILFSHHSVGTDILAGIKRLDDENPEAGRLRIRPLTEAVTLQGPVLIDISGGRNKEPKTKIDHFAATIRSETRLKPDLDFLKLCFVDFSPHTDVDDLFGYYRKTFEALKQEYPGIRFAHVAVPVTTRPTGLKSRIFRLIGRDVWQDAANAKRAEFSRRLKQSFGSDPVFDLARVEATAPDGQLMTFEHGGRSYFSLYPGYTDDGAHLNAAGQRAAGAGRTVPCWPGRRRDGDRS